MFEVRGINGNVSFTAIIFFLFEHSPYIFITPRMSGLNIPKYCVIPEFVGGEVRKSMRKFCKL